MSEMKTIYRCQHCYSDNVQVKAWVRPNNNNVFIDEVNPDELGWCEDCELNVVVETVEMEENAEVIGFQVVGEDGTPQEGETHPDMDGSFCVYNLGQARLMLSGNNL